MSSMPVDEEIVVVSESTITVGGVPFVARAESTGSVFLGYSALEGVIPWELAEGSPAEIRRYAIALLIIADAAEGVAS